MSADRTHLRPDTTVVATRDQISCDVANEGVILNMGRGTYFGLNEVGNAIWRMVQQPRTLAGIRDRIAECYEVEPAQCEQDVVALLDAMLSAGLIEVLDAAAE